MDMKSTPRAPYQPPQTSGGPVYAQALTDAHFLTERFRRHYDVRRALGSIDDMYATKEELCSMLLSAAATASLVAFRRPDDFWRLDVAREESAEGLRLLLQLEELRSVMRRSDRGIRDMLMSRKVRPSLKRCAALCALALYAVPDELMPEFAAFAGVQPGSQDPEGDAQHIAELHDCAGTIPLNT